MIVFESRIARRFVGRLERGEEVIATLRQLCEHERIRAAWIHGAGMLEWVELTEWDPEREAWRAPRRVEGPLTVLSLEGNVSIRNGPPWVQLHVMVARQTGPGTFETLGGTVASARVYALEFAFDVYEDVRLERDEEAATGLSLFKGSSVRGVFARAGERTQELARPKPAPVVEDDEDEPEEEQPASRTAAATPAAATGGGVSWAVAAAVSQEAEKRAAAMPARRAPPSPPPLIPDVTTPKAVPIPEARERDTSFLDEPIPQKGDFVDHRQFGLCRVEGEDEDGGLRIRLPSGVRKVIRLDFLEVLPPRHEGDRKVFPLRPRKR
ncbi:PPC domain-containing DNA-binding protein [Sandaracinus amylolyticus]|uniref:PPC domain-containing protein n=1 Tax=Sandaracinus amylolyticus TaxID=927083 RepID=A0A0F6W3M9_9BACT|nr:PPC domain-containing DNA-binding protein [Sandaracinus amylolyticus]AKF06471.1 hypothetical protein DB32_003620 [Sandaracinus amylolyticus]